MEYLEASVRNSVTQFISDTIERYRDSSNIAIDSAIYLMFKRKGIDCSYVFEGRIDPIPGCDIKLRAIILTLDEYTKMCNSSPTIVSYTRCSTITLVNSIPMITYVLIGKSYIALFDKLIKSMNPYINKDVHRLTSSLAIANDTISQLRIELKTFRSAKKKERKKLAKPPPEYIDERPPDF